MGLRSNQERSLPIGRLNSRLGSRLLERRRGHRSSVSTAAPRRRAASPPRGGPKAHDNQRKRKKETRGCSPRAWIGRGGAEGGRPRQRAAGTAGAREGGRRGAPWAPWYREQLRTWAVKGRPRLEKPMTLCRRRNFGGPQAYRGGVPVKLAGLPRPRWGGEVGS
jgi:hypothetical protein